MELPAEHTERGASARPADGVRSRVLAENVRLHRDVAASYDRIHPHMRNSFEQHLQRRDVTHMVAGCADPPMRVLELGCGTGNLTMQFLEAGCSVVGVDMSAEMLAELRRKAAGAAVEHRCELHEADVDGFLQRDGRSGYHIIAMSSVAHHLPDYLATLTALSRRLRPGGFLYLIHEPTSRDELARRAVPLRRLWSIVPRGLDRLIRDMRPSRAAVAQEWRAYDTKYADYHYHLAGISIAALRTSLQERGLTLREASNYNAHDSSVVSWIDNFCFPFLRYEQFQRTYFRAVWQRAG
jgi:ubiquinone/menaquinone biosynthesis C-methylase UbiE